MGSVAAGESIVIPVTGGQIGADLRVPGRAPGLVIRAWQRQQSIQQPESRSRRVSGVQSIRDVPARSAHPGGGVS
jgi:hypothetical protein